MPSAYPDRYLPLLRELCGDPRWRILYTDGTQALLAFGGAKGAPEVDLSSSTTVAAIVAELRGRYRDLPTARDLALVHLGRLLAEVGKLARAEEVLQPLGLAAARGLLARVHYLAGRREQARGMALALLQEQPGEVNSLDLLALIALDSGDQQQALELLRKALQSDPFDITARRILLRLRGEAAAGSDAVGGAPR